MTGGLPIHQIRVFSVKQGVHGAVFLPCRLQLGKFRSAKALVAVTLKITVEPQGSRNTKGRIQLQIVAAHTGQRTRHHPAAGPKTHADAAAVPTQHTADLCALWGQRGLLHAQILHHFLVVGKIACGKDNGLFRPETDRTVVTILGDDADDPAILLLQIFGGGQEMELSTRLLCPVNVGKHRFRNAPVVPECLREGGGTHPGLNAVEVADIFAGRGRKANLNTFLLLRGEGIVEPVEALAAVFYKFHHQSGIASVAVAELPVVEELQLIHFRDALTAEKI